MTQTMRERLIAAAAKADRETCTEDVDWQPVTNWPEVIDAILDVLREPDEGMSEAGARAVSAEWPPKSGKRGDALVDTGREGEVSEEWQIKQFDADDAFTAMIDHVREREAVSDLPTKWNGDAEPGAAVAMITLKSDGPLFPAGKPTPRNPP